MVTLIADDYCCQHSPWLAGWLVVVNDEDFRLLVAVVSSSPGSMFTKAKVVLFLLMHKLQQARRTDMRRLVNKITFQLIYSSIPQQATTLSTTNDTHSPAGVESVAIISYSLSAPGSSALSPSRSMANILSFFDSFADKQSAGLSCILLLAVASAPFSSR